MKQVIAARLPHYHDVVMFECAPIAIIQDYAEYEHGRWYVTCGGEGEFFLSNREACEYFTKLHVFAQAESNRNKAAIGDKNEM